MVQRTADGPFPQIRIDSWKSIARHLGKSSRTVQRWHREYGLPIHRLGVDSGSVFAYADELDRWLRNRDRDPKNTLIEMPPPARPLGFHVPPEPDQFRGFLVSDCISGSGKEQSAALVAFASKLWKGLSSENLVLIAKCFRKAVDLDPSNAQAFAGLAHALITEGMMGNLRIPDAYLSAKAALERAVEIDAESPEVKCAAAALKMLWERDWHGARQGYDDCLKQRSCGMLARSGRALLYIAEGSPKDASRLLREVIQQNTLNARAAALCCWSEYLAGDYWSALSRAEEARICGQSGPVMDVVEALACIQCEKPDASIRRIEPLAADSPHHMLLRGVLGYAFALSGQTQRAAAILEAMTHPAACERAAAPYAIALVLIGLNEKHDAVQWLEQSFCRGSLWSLAFPVDPILQPLRDEPGYRTFLSRVSYPVSSSHRHMTEGSSAISMEGLRVSGA